MKLLAVMLLGIGLLLTGCSDESPGDKEFRVGLIAPISGQIPELGLATVEAAKLAVREVNDRGGLLIDDEWYRVVLLVEDNEDNPEQSVSAALRLINQQNVSAIVGPQASRNAIPVARYAEYANIPMISPSSTNPETTRYKEWVFRVAIVDTFQGRLMARFAFEELGLRKAAVLYDISSEYNRHLAEVFREEFKDLGGGIVAFELYTRDVPDVTEQLRRIKMARPEALFLPNYYSEVPQQARLARKLGIEAQLLGTDSWSQILPEERKAVEGAFFTTHYAVDRDDGQLLGFRARYRQAYSREPNEVAALTYDAFGILFEAARRHGGVEPQGLRDAINTLDSYDGITGNIEFRGSGDPVRSAVLVEVKDGEFGFSKWVEP